MFRAMRSIIGVPTCMCVQGRNSVRSKYAVTSQNWFSRMKNVRHHRSFSVIWRHVSRICKCVIPKDRKRGHLVLTEIIISITEYRIRDSQRLLSASWNTESGTHRDYYQNHGIQNQVLTEIIISIVEYRIRDSQRLLSASWNTESGTHRDYYQLRGI